MSNPKMPDLNALMKQAQKLQGDVARIQEELAKMTCEGAAGGGLVTATVNGQFEVVRVNIDKSVVDPNDIGMLEDLDAHFYVCGPSMAGYGVREEELIVADYTIGATVTWADLLARTDVHVLSKAQFDKP